MLVCNDIWKVYGRNATGLLQKLGGDPSAELLKEAGIFAAVRNINITIAKGEIFVIMGLSGSGKSTLLRCMTRLIEPSRGSISLDGVDLLKASGRELIQLRRHKMGMVFQNYALMPHLTALHNVALPLKVKGESRASRERRALEMLQLVSLQEREHYFPHELSGGQQQRVGIARSLALNPEIWLLDEPFSALDPLVRREMQDEFLRLQRKLNKTIVFVTHDFTEAIRLADRIAIMRDGLIVQVGTAEDLALNPAEPYVSEFMRDIPLSQVVSVCTIMSTGALAGGSDLPLLTTDRIIQVAPRVLATDKAIDVATPDGKHAGTLGRDALISFLATEFKTLNEKST